MDKIYRIISLEQAKNRTPNSLPHYLITDISGSTISTDGWGGYCCDIKVPSNKGVELYSWIYQLEDIYGFRKTYESNGKRGRFIYYHLRYKNLMRMYHWIYNTFIPSIDFYQKCNTDAYRYVKIKDKNKLFTSSIDEIPLFESIDDAQSASTIDTGTIIGITSMYNEFINKFVSYSTCRSFLSFMDKLLKEGLFHRLTQEIPYIDVNFSITSNDVDMGILSEPQNIWVPKKKYYLGEVVSYNGEQYILTKCNVGSYDKYELTGELLDEVLSNRNKYNVVDESGLTTDTTIFKLYYYHNFVVSNKQCVLETQEDITKYYFIYPYYAGEYDSVTRIAAFDSTDKHWTPFKATGQETVEYTGVTESKLIALKRRVSSVDDNGEILPFILEKINDNPVQYDTNGELQYMYGITNETKYDDGTFMGDALIDISIQDTGDTWISVINDSAHTCTSEEFSDTGYPGYVKFVYIIGCELERDETTDISGNTIVTYEIIPKTGVKYEEVWKYEVKQMDNVSVDGSSYSFNYVLFTPTDDNEYTDNLDVVNKIPILSKITYYSKKIEDVNRTFIPRNTIKNEELLGIQDINTLEYDMHSGVYVSTLDTYITRGTGSALERHEILGEVKTLADLENYRNNFFQI